MSTTMNRQGTVIGAFDREDDAQSAVRDLQSMGFNETDLAIAAHYAEPSAFTDNSAKTAAVGAATGLSAGTLWGLGIIAGILPGIGPAIAGGALAALLSSAAAGAATGGLAGAFIGLGVADEDAHRADSDFRAGKTIVTVKAGDRSETAIEVLKFHQSAEH